MRKPRYGETITNLTNRRKAVVAIAKGKNIKHIDSKGNVKYLIAMPDEELYNKIKSETTWRGSLYRSCEAVGPAMVLMTPIAIALLVIYFGGFLNE